MRMVKSGFKYIVLASLLYVPCYGQERVFLFEDLLNALNEFVDTGAPFKLSDLFTVDGLGIPAALKKVLDETIVVNRFLSISPKDQSAELQFTISLFGQPILAKLRMGLEYPGPKTPTKKPVPAGEIAPPPVAPPEKIPTQASRPPVAPPMPGTSSELEAAKREVKAAQLAQETESEKDIFEETFEKIGQRAVKDIEVITKPEQTLEKLKQNTFLKIKSAKPVFSLLLGLPEGFKLSAIDSRLKFLDVLQFYKCALVISQANYIERDWGLRVAKGLNLTATLKVAGPVERITRLTGENLTTLTLQGLIDPAIVGSKFMALIPGRINLGKNIQTTGLSLALYLKDVGLTLGVSTGLMVRVPNQEDPLLFTGEVTIAPEKASFEFYMTGMWENVFGIPGPKIGNVKFKATTDYTVAAASGGALTLSGLGIGGEMGIGSKSALVNVYGEISTTEDIMVEGAIKGGIYLEDIVSFGFDIIQGAAKIAQLIGRASEKDIDISKLRDFRHIIEEQVPNLGFDSALVSISPKVLWFGGKKYDGIELDAVGSILDKKLAIHFKLDKTGIEALGYMSKIVIGPITISGAGSDKKEGTPDDGPKVGLIIKPTQGQAQLFLNGKLDVDILGGFSSETILLISPTGLHGKLRQNIFNQFKINFELSANLKSPKDFFIRGYFEQEALSNLERLLEDGSRQLITQARQDLEQARKKVKAAQDAVAQAKKEVGELEKLRKKIEAENKQSIARARAKAEQDVRAYERSKQELDANIRKCKGDAPQAAAADIERSAQIGEPTPEDRQRARDELKRMGLNDSQIEAIINQM